MEKKWLHLFSLSLLFFLMVCAMPPDNGSSVLDDFLKAVHESDDPGRKSTLAEAFYKKLQAQPYPLFENDTTFVLVYKGTQDSAGVLGDLSNWSETLWMDRVPGTDLFYLRGHAPADARIEYWLMFGENSLWSVDPLNPFKSLNGFGELSELAMPRYERHPYFNDYLDGRKGSSDGLRVHEIDSKFLGYPHTIHVCLPPGYDAAHEYPVLYLQDGIDYVEFAQVPHILERLIADGKIEAMLAVFVTPPNRFKADFPNRMSEYGLNDAYVRFFADELVPFIDATYSTRAVAGARLVTGDSFGGLISAYIPFARPEVFACGYSQSGYLSFQQDRLIDLYRTQEKRDIRLYVDSGLYEERVGASFLPAAESDFLAANRRFRVVLQERGYAFVYREYAEGHTWGNWRRHLIDALMWFFPARTDERPAGS